MIGSFLYFIALIATCELEMAEQITTQPTQEIPFMHLEQKETISDCGENIETDLKTIEIVEHLAKTNSADTIEKILPTTPITISNEITADMLAYKHWTGTYSPETFTLYINETPVAPGEKYSLVNSKDHFVVRFDYSFMKGLRKGTKTFTYTINTLSTNAILTFSWLNSDKIIIDNATLIQEKKA